MSEWKSVLNFNLIHFSLQTYNITVIICVKSVIIKLKFNLN